MGIAALPADTVRAIGSTQCLTDPASVVKELVNNSLDAGATSIFVELSSNTIDKIKVRDNGHGIAPEDRSVACKRHCTSKIRSLEDLHDLGGQSLGFRGEALASAAEMSSKIILITRVEGESTAMEIEYDRSGLVKSEKRVSHAIGTTIQVDHFLSNFPVRKQTAEKSSIKYLTKTKKLLQAYALARPHIRLSLKVLKAKNDKGDWNYAPKARAANNCNFISLALDAAIKIFGTKVGEQVQLYSSTWSSIGEAIELARPEPSGATTAVEDAYTLDLVLFHPKCTDIAVLNGLGQHVSIDNRPVSCSRGILKKIIGHYKSGLRSALNQNGDGNITDPLLVMNIGCPKGSYDINVEPAKDDILFANANVVLQIVQKTFNNIYGEPQVPLPKRRTQQCSPEKNGFDTLLARKSTNNETSMARQSPPHAAFESLAPHNHLEVSRNASTNCRNTHIEVSSHDFGRLLSDEGTKSLSDDQDEARILAKKNSTWRASMCTVDDDDFELYSIRPITSRMETEPTDQERDPRNANLSNPWTFAKLSASTRPPMAQDESRKGGTTTTHLPTPRRQRGDIANRHELSSDDRQPSRSISPYSFPYPSKAFGKRQSDDVDGTPSMFNIDQSGRGALDSWLRRSGDRILLDPHSRGGDGVPEDRYAPPPELTSLRILPLHGTALRNIPDVSQRPRARTSRGGKQAGAIERPFISPVYNPERVWFEIGETRQPHHQKSSKPESLSKPLKLPDPSPSPSLLPPEPHALNPIHPDLAITLDYEARKAKATQAHKDHLRKEKAAEIARQHAEVAKQRTLDSLLGPHATRSSPHKNRQVRAVAALHADDKIPADNDAATVAAAEEKRSNLGPPLSSKRRRWMMLPLERVKEEDWVADLILPLSTNQAVISKEMQKAVDWDDYVYQGESPNGLHGAEAGMLMEWEGRLRQLVGRLYRKGDPHVEEGTSVGEGPIVLDLCGILLTPGTENA